MKKYAHFYGIDISKKTVDIVYTNQQEFIHQRFDNDVFGMDQLLQWLEQHNTMTEDTLFCMEATGLYCLTLTNFLYSKSIDVWVEHASTIKKATALARGKNDKVDAQRIATYACKNSERARLWKPLNMTLEKIKNLASLRERLVDTIKRLAVPIQEFEERGDHTMAKLLTKSIRKTVTALHKDLAELELQIKELINQDESLRSLYKIITSVVGIGFVTAVNLMIHTHGFSIMNDARKLACYCGVAPFEYSSGTSIKGRTRVHHMANKKLKCNLHMASLTAIKRDEGIKTYYNRKVAEGKNKMSVLNAVKNKLLTRVVACVINQRMYVKQAA